MDVLEISKSKASVVTIGTFDGIHVGHQNILKRVVHIANSKNLTSVVLTLFPHPRMILQKEDSIKLLNTIEERIVLLKTYGIEQVIIKPFTKTFANQTAKNYVKQILVDELKAKYVIVGYDHHFGKNRSANLSDLKTFAEMYNFKVEEIPAQDIKDITVSSTKIRKALSEGKINLAKQYLGYNYNITGKIIEGKGIGRTINFRTANIHMEDHYKLIPKDGVYVVQSKINKDLVFGMMNIGSNPTVNGVYKTIEVHFFNYNQNIYGNRITITFLKRLRDEQKFKNLEALKTQLNLDKKTSLQFIKQYSTD